MILLGEPKPWLALLQGRGNGCEIEAHHDLLLFS
jgi:hypothetical protein